MTKDRNPIQDFLDIINKMPSLWRSIDIRVLAVKVGNKWCNLITHCYLNPLPKQKVKPPPDLPVITEYVGAWQIIRPITSLSAIMRAVERGKWEFQENEVSYLNNQFADDLKTYPYNFSSYSFGSLTYRHHAELVKWSAYYTYAFGSLMSNFLKEISIDHYELDNAVRSLPNPHDGINGLAKYLVGFTGGIWNSCTAAFYVYAPVEARFDLEGCRFEGGEFHYKIIAGSKAAVELCSMGFTAQKGDKQDRGTIPLVEKNWEEHEEGHCYTGRICFKGCESATLFLRVGAHTAHQVSREDFSAKGKRPQIRIYEIFDGNLKVFRSCLRPTGKSASSIFEQAVARLFRFAGFQVEPLADDKRLSDAVDVVVFDAFSGRVFAIECTLKGLNANGKLGKLVTRAKEMEDDTGYATQGVMVTALEEDKIPQGDVESASQGNIAVLCQEDLEKILDMALNNEPAAEVVSYIKGRVPRFQGR